MAGNSLVTPSYLQAHDLDHTASELVHRDRDRGSLMRANESGNVGTARGGIGALGQVFVGATWKRRKERRQ